MPPEELLPFLHWLREHTERAWSQVEEDGGRRRAKRWTGGLTTVQIEQVEARHGVTFGPDHRLFLQTLHATEPNRTSVYNWLEDGAEIRAALDRVFEGLIFDVEHNVLWLDSWGSRPDDRNERAMRVAELMVGAPRLLPISGHRHVVAAAGLEIVLSVSQADIIVYGANLREYLLNDFAGGHDFTRVDTSGIPFWGELIENNHA